MVLDIDFQGDEIPETTARIRRRVWTDDPDDLASAMHYEVTKMESAEMPDDPSHLGLRPAAIRVLNVIVKTDDWWTVRTIGDALAEDETGRLPLKARTIQDALKQLVRPSLVGPTGILGSSGGRWRLAVRNRQKWGRRCVLTRAHIAHALSMRTVQTQCARTHNPL